MDLKVERFDRQAFDFIDSVDRLETPDAVMEEVHHVVGRFGFERMVAMGLRPKPGQSCKDLLFASWMPEEFCNIYRDKSYVLVDPNAVRALQSTRPFAWSEKTLPRDMEPAAKECMQACADFRIERGFMVPIHGPDGYEACFAMAGVHLELDQRTKPMLHLMALYAFERVSELTTAEPETKPALTGREREVLAWAARGKSAWETGEILKVAKRTVDEHAQTAMRKLGAANRTQAVAIALRHRLFDV